MKWRGIDGTLSLWTLAGHPEAKNRHIREYKRKENCLYNATGFSFINVGVFWFVRLSRLKILVSVVRFRPGPPNFACDSAQNQNAGFVSDVRKIKQLV